MNLKRIDAARASYERTADEATRARLAFFEPVWQIQAQAAQTAAVTATPTAYVTADLERWYWEQKPFLLEAPVDVDAPLFTATASQIADALLAQEAFGEEAAEALRSLDWFEAVSAAPLSLAGSDPAAYLDTAYETLLESLGDAAEAAVMVLSLALRPMLEPTAEAALKAIAPGINAAGAEHAKPRLCPVCGGEAAVAFVGPTPTGKPNGRTFYCAQCGATWECERIRCARCGTQSQTHLHYRSIEGDDAHRLHCCDLCSGYIRTRFAQEGDLAPFVPEVEDVVMVGLDALAQSLGMGSGPQD